MKTIWHSIPKKRKADYDFLKGMWRKASSMKGLLRRARWKATAAIMFGIASIGGWAFWTTDFGNSDIIDGCGIDWLIALPIDFPFTEECIEHDKAFIKDAPKVFKAFKMEPNEKRLRGLNPSFRPKKKFSPIKDETF